MMNKEQLMEMLALSAGHPYFQLKKGEVPRILTHLSQEKEVDQDEELTYKALAVGMTLAARPMRAKIYPLLDQIVSGRSTFLLREWDLADVKQVRLLCDAFVRFYKREDPRVFGVGSAKRFEFLLRKCAEVKEALSGGGDFWLKFQQLDTLVYFCLQNQSFQPRDERFKPIRDFLLVMYDYAAKELQEMLGKEYAGQLQYSTVFTDAPEGMAAQRIYEVKKKFLEDPEMAMRERTRILAGEDGGSPALVTGMVELFPVFDVNLKSLTVNVLDVFGNLMEEGGNLSVFLVYDHVTMKEACNLCREIHAVLSNEAVYEELYVVQRDFYAGRVNLQEIPVEDRAEMRNGLMLLLDRLLEEGIISDDVYDEEVKYLERLE